MIRFRRNVIIGLIIFQLFHYRRFEFIGPTCLLLRFGAQAGSGKSYRVVSDLTLAEFMPKIPLD